MLALLISEFLITFMGLLNSIALMHMMPPSVFFVVDIPCLALAGTMYALVNKYWTRYEEELDTWGLNIANYILYYTGYGNISEKQYKDVDHVGSLKPSGTIG